MLYGKYAGQVISGLLGGGRIAWDPAYVISQALFT